MTLVLIHFGELCLAPPDERPAEALPFCSRLATQKPPLLASSASMCSSQCLSHHRRSRRESSLGIFPKYSMIARWKIKEMLFISSFRFGPNANSSATWLRMNKYVVTLKSHPTLVPLFDKQPLFTHVCYKQLLTR